MGILLHRYYKTGIVCTTMSWHVIVANDVSIIENLLGSIWQVHRTRIIIDIYFAISRQYGS